MSPRAQGDVSRRQARRKGEGSRPPPRRSAAGCLLRDPTLNALTRVKSAAEANVRDHHFLFIARDLQPSQIPRTTWTLPNPTIFYLPRHRPPLVDAEPPSSTVGVLFGAYSKTACRALRRRAGKPGNYALQQLREPRGDRPRQDPPRIKVPSWLPVLPAYLARYGASFF